MNKGALLETLETGLVVTVITVLIWLFAEGETIQPVTKTVDIEFVAPNTTMAVEIDGEPTATQLKKVDITLQVSRSNRGKIDQYLREQAIKIEVQPTEAGTTVQVINLKDELAASPLTELGGYVQSTDPSTYAVRLIELRTIDMPIVPLLGELQLSEEAPKFKHEIIPVTLPKDLADRAVAEGLSLYAMMNKLDTSSFVEGNQFTRNVKLELPPELENPHAKFDPNNVVTFIVLKRTQDITLPQVQVRVAISDLWTGQYQIEIEPERFIEVDLRGSAEVIEDIGQNNELVWALIKLNSDDLAEGTHQAPLNIFVPEGVAVVSPKPLRTMIDYTVSPTVETP